MNRPCINQEACLAPEITLDLLHKFQRYRTLVATLNYAIVTNNKNIEQVLILTEEAFVKYKKHEVEKITELLMRRPVFYCLDIDRGIIKYE